MPLQLLIVLIQLLMQEQSEDISISNIKVFHQSIHYNHHSLLQSSLIQQVNHIVQGSFPLDTEMNPLHHLHLQSL